MIEEQGATTTATATAPAPVDRGYLLRYRVMAFTTATLLIILVFVGLPLQLAAHHDQVVNVVGTIHGFLYIVYLLTAFQLTRRLKVPKLKMALVLLAGTVPFAAFVAERSLTRRFVDADPTRATGRSTATDGVGLRQRWLSRRAVVLHLEVLVLAPACAVAGWWQATRALAGNGLSWFYSVEWPVFAILAVVGWWYLIHEDPAAYRARKQRPPSDATGALSEADRQLLVTVERTTARLATALAVLVGIEFLLGVVALVVVPIGRPSGWQPSAGKTVYISHASLGIPLFLGALMMLVRIRGASRISVLSGWFGGVGVAVSGLGGLLTVSHTWRFAGVALMFLGAIVAGFGYLFPALEKMRS